jgi:hypothetical protein
MDHLVVLTRGPWTTDSLGNLARVIPKITEIEPTPVRQVLATAQDA